MQKHTFSCLHNPLIVIHVNNYINCNLAIKSASLRALWILQSGYAICIYLERVKLDFINGDCITYRMLCFGGKISMVSELAEH